MLIGIAQDKIGRDYLFDLLSEHKLLVRQRKRKAVTTDSRHWMRKYSNLIRDMPVIRPEQVWVSDITYIRLINQMGLFKFNYRCLFPKDCRILFS